MPRINTRLLDIDKDKHRAEDSNCGNNTKVGSISTKNVPASLLARVQVFIGFVIWRDEYLWVVSFEPLKELQMHQVVSE